MSFDRPFCFIHTVWVYDVCGMESLCCRCGEGMRGGEVRVDCVASYTQSGCMLCVGRRVFVAGAERMRGDEFW